MSAAYLITLWNQDDRKTCFWMPVGNGKRRKKPEPVKLSLIQKIINRVKEMGG